VSSFAAVRPFKAWERGGSKEIFTFLPEKSLYISQSQVYIQPIFLEVSVLLIGRAESFIAVRTMMPRFCEAGRQDQLE